MPPKSGRHKRASPPEDDAGIDARAGILEQKDMYIYMEVWLCKRGRFGL